MKRIFDGRLWVSYGQFYIESSESSGYALEDCFVGQINGLCGAASKGSLFLLTGLHTGEIKFTLDVLDNAPSLDRIWEEIVEVSFTPTSEKLIIRQWNGECICKIPFSQQNYRVRYCACNMDRGHELDTYVEGNPVDLYYLAFWPAKPTSDVILKQTSEVASYWHNWVTTLKP